MKRVMIRTGRRPGQVTAALIALGICALLFALSTLRHVRSPLVRSAESAEEVSRELVLEGCEGHMLTLLSSSSAQQARVEAARFASRGTCGYVYETAGVYYVIGALYASREDAERVAEKAGEAEGLPCGVISLWAEPVRLSMQGTEEEIGLFSAADATLRDVLDKLVPLSFALDGGGTDYARVRDELSACAAQVEAMLAPARESYRLAHDPVGSGLFSQLKELRDALGGLLRDAGPDVLACSGRIKYLALAGRLRMIEYLKGLRA